MLRKVLLGLGVIVVAIAALAIWRAEEIGRLLAVNTLFSEERIVENFSSMDTMFRSRPVPVTGDVETFSVQPLPLPATLDVAGETLDVAEYLADTATTSLLILRDGKIAHEEYFLGTGPDDLRISWSMAKSILSVAMGVAVADGLVD
ncbi:MAG: 6-aminohexanoate hydrolase, partial [Pseudomonadota bacterium]